MDPSVATLLVLAGTFGGVIVGAIIAASLVLRSLKVSEERPTAVNQIRDSLRSITDAFNSTIQSTTTSSGAQIEILRRRAEQAEASSAQLRGIAESLAARMHAPPPAAPSLQNGAASAASRTMTHDFEAVPSDNVEGEGIPLGRIR